MSWSLFLNAITNNLLDPSWWFTAVFIAVFSSIIAAFAKDYLERKFGFFLAWTAKTRAERSAHREEVIAAWSSNEGLLTIILLRMLYSVVLFLFGGTVLVLYVTYIKLKFPSTTGLTGMEEVPLRMLATFLILTLLTSNLAYWAGTRISLAQACLKRFESSKKLPKLASDNDI